MLRCSVLVAALFCLADGFGFPTTFLHSKTHVAKSAHSFAGLSSRRPLTHFRSPISRTRQAAVLGLRAEEPRKFEVGDAVEAQWIGDDSWYAGKIEGLWANGAYDVMWADPQGLAPTQATLESAIRAFDPTRYYKFGLQALDQDDVETAYLSFRTVFILVGDFGKTRQYIADLLNHPTVGQIYAERGDGEVLFRATAAPPKKEYTEEEKKEREADGKEDSEEDEIYSQEELLKLRDEAKEESMTQDMWKQFSVFRESQAGTWQGLWTDYKFEKEALVETGTRKGRTEMACEINAGGFPEHSVRVEVDGKEELALQKRGFFPTTDCSWFVGNAHTEARLEDARLDLEVGLRHTDSRVRVICTYQRGPASEDVATWDLERVTVAREALERDPSPEQDPCLFAAKKGADTSITSQGTLSGPADRLSTQLYNAQSKQPTVSISCEGAVTVTCPTFLPEAEDPPMNKEVVLEWSTSARPGIAWDGKDRIIPALHYRCARVFKRPSESIEMLSLTENAPSE